MAAMRLRAFLAAFTAVLVLLALPAVAAADPKPIAKPPAATPQPAPPPPSPPPASAPPPAPPPPPAAPASPPSTPRTPTVEKPVVVLVASGGRDQSNAIAPELLPPAQPKPPPAPHPTPLALVALSERNSSHGEATPAWKLALLALLAASEAFLVVRLVRHRPTMLATAR
jgi:hypothetical protein